MENKEKNFFGMPYFYLTVFLILIIILLILPPFHFQTAKVIENIELTKREYFPNERISGVANLQFKFGDLVPSNSLVEFRILNSSSYNFSTVALLLPQAIALSSTPTKGNYSYGNYNNVDGPEPKGEGYGFGGCAYITTKGNIGASTGSTGGALFVPPISILPDLVVSDIYIYNSSTNPQDSAIASQKLERLYAKIKNRGGSCSNFLVIGCWYNGTNIIINQADSAKNSENAVSSSENSAAVPQTQSPKMPPSLPSNCFFSQSIATLKENQEIILDMGLQAVEGKTVQVIADYGNAIVESDENNNIMVKSFAAQQKCFDNDDVNYYFKGICLDSQGSHEDYCNPNADNILMEWRCSSAATSQTLCQIVPYVCPNGCNNGACIVEQPRQACKDSDNGKNYGVRGTCTDQYGSFTDYCLELTIPESPNLAEFYCSGNQLIKIDSCSDCEAKCLYPFTDSEGWYAVCGKERKLISYVATGKCNDEEYLKKFKPVCLFNDSAKEGWYTQDICEREDFHCYYGCGEGKCKISNYSCEGWDNIYRINLANLNLKVPEQRGYYILEMNLIYKDKQGKIVMASDEKNLFVASHRACQNYSCVWVSGNGTDQCETSDECRTRCAVEGEIIMPPRGELCCQGLIAIPNLMPTENGCIGPFTPRVCSYCGNGVCGVGENYCNCPQDCNEDCGNGICESEKGENNETCPADCIVAVCGNHICEVNETENCPQDCEATGGTTSKCNENWQYSSWSDCINGIKTRECYDANSCGTTYAKPVYCVATEGKFIQTQSCVPGCQENWQCAEWSYCNEQSHEQSAICEEANKCNLQNYSYIQLRDCCVEEWHCKWSSCQNGVQQKICVDLNNCGTEFNKPELETRVCKGKVTIWTWLIIIVTLIVAILLILRFTKIIGPKKIRTKLNSTKQIKPMSIKSISGERNEATFKDISKFIN